MKKILAILLAVMMISACAACGKDEPAAGSTTAATDASEAAATTRADAETTKHITVAGKTIMLKSNDSLDFVEINTDENNVATNMMLHKFYADDASYKAAVEKGDYDSYVLITSIDINREIIYSGSDAVKGMTYDEIIAQAEKLANYTIVPTAE